MKYENYRLLLWKKKLKDTEQKHKFIEAYKKTIKYFAETKKDRMESGKYGFVKWEQGNQPEQRNSIIKTIGEIFGVTALMSITVLSILSVLILSFVMSELLTYFREFGWLTLGLAGIMLGVSWYKPYKIWSLIIAFLGSFLFIVTFGPLIIEAYTGGKLIDVTYKNGYLLTLKATLVFVSYVIGGITFTTWIYLICKGQRQNPLSRLRYLQFRTKNT
ncbi:hypothetical protein [Paenisporosarcina sp. TG-14]|uniref:hypothetical protein n=1 Tax=Paenisporosarcina sp. TG-14 TaxID=1231057 RepID=UPI00031F6B88|nr:hypothetical protein [Paenisporosarcina sp. TG-14]